MTAALNKAATPVLPPARTVLHGVDCPYVEPGCEFPVARFASIVGHYRPSGGLLNESELVRMLLQRTEQPISLLARWIVHRKVVSFAWRSQNLFPLAQFDVALMVVRPAWSQVIEELAPAFDDLELASWFAQPNSWLIGATPVDTMAHDVAAVVQAARADRFIAMG